AQHMEGGSERSVVQRWLDMYKTLLEYQADPTQTIVITQRIGKKSILRPVSVLTVIREVFSKWNPTGSKELESQLPKDLVSEIQSLNNQSVLSPSPRSPVFLASPTGSTFQNAASIHQKKQA